MRGVQDKAQVGPNSDQNARTSHQDRGICRGRPKGRLRTHPSPRPLPVIICSRALPTRNAQRLETLFAIWQPPGNRGTLAPPRHPPYQYAYLASAEHATPNAWRRFLSYAEASDLRACRTDISVKPNLTSEAGRGSPPTSPPSWGWPPASGLVVNHLAWPGSKVLCFTIGHRGCGVKQTHTRKCWQTDRSDRNTGVNLFWAPAECAKRQQMVCQGMYWSTNRRIDQC